MMTLSSFPLLGGRSNGDCCPMWHCFRFLTFKDSRLIYNEKKEIKDHDQSSTVVKYSWIGNNV